MNHVKDKLARGEITYGIWVSWSSPDLIEFCGKLGFEYVVLDTEHGSIGLETCANLIRACELCEVIPIVRVGECTQATILTHLDQGALGIVVPHVKDAANAQAIIDAVRFYPLGSRGMGASRALNYGLWGNTRLDELVRSSNEEILTLATIEDREGMRNIDEILAVEGIDAIGIGRIDLSVSMGVPGQVHNHEIQSVISQTEKKILSSGKILDAVERDIAGARRAIEKGARMIGVRLEAILGSAGAEFLSGMKKHQSE